MLAFTSREPKIDTRELSKNNKKELSNLPRYIKNRENGEVVSNEERLFEDGRYK